MDDVRELIGFAQRGDRTAFRGLVDAHKRLVFGLAFDLTGHREDAEDLSQEVFIKAWRSIGRFRGECTFSTWLYTITVRTWIGMHRARNMKVRDSSTSLDEDTIGEHRPSTASAADNPESNAEGALVGKHIERAMDTLSPRERSVFSLRFLNELKLSEIGDAIGISEGAVKSHLFKALRKMRKELAFLAER